MSYTNIYNKTLAKYKNGGVNQQSAMQLNNKMKKSLNSPSTISNNKGNYDRIIRIVNIFQKAYDKYATDYIPSGRPGGRISLSTFREYEYIGTSGKPEWKEDSGPGYGPWINKWVFEGWEKEVMSILEDPNLRKVLANTNFISDAEKDTNTEQDKKSSGTNLISFIEELINGKGSFKEIRSKMMKKYFNINEKDDDRRSDDRKNTNTSTNQQKTNKEVNWKNLESKNWKNIRIKKGNFYRINYDWSDGKGIGESKGSSTKSNFIIYILDTSVDNLIFLANRSSDDITLLENIISNYDLSKIGKRKNKQSPLCIMSNVEYLNEFVNNKMWMISKENWANSTIDFKPLFNGNTPPDDVKDTDNAGIRKINKINRIEVLTDGKDEINVIKKIDEIKPGGSQNSGHPNSITEIKKLLK